MINQLITERNKNEIIDMLFRKRDKRKCTSTLNVCFQDNWDFFDINCTKSKQNSNFEWKVYILVRSEHYGFVVKK